MDFWGNKINVTKDSAHVAILPPGFLELTRPNGPHSKYSSL